MPAFSARSSPGRPKAGSALGATSSPERAPAKVRYPPLRTLDSLRLRLTVEQPSSGIPRACQTKTSDLEIPRSEWWCPRTPSPSGSHSFRRARRFGAQSCSGRQPALPSCSASLGCSAARLRRKRVTADRLCRRVFLAAVVAASAPSAHGEDMNPAKITCRAFLRSGHANMAVIIMRLRGIARARPEPPRTNHPIPTEDGWVIIARNARMPT
jgi:hypothetical protein